MNNIVIIYLVILIAKITEVTLATTRIVLITKGEKGKGAVIGFFEVIIWLLIVSAVLTDINSDPFKMVFYALGFALGNYFGSILEQKLGVGAVKVEVIVMDTCGSEIAAKLREMGFAVTMIDAKGMTSNRSVLIMHVRRKRLKIMTDTVKELNCNSVITINDIRPVYGGFGLLKK